MNAQRPDLGQSKALTSIRPIGLYQVSWPDERLRPAC
jgi:hypothetical protein